MNKLVSAFLACMTLLASPAIADPKNGALGAAQAWVDAINRHDVDGIVATFASNARFFGTSTKVLVDSSDGIRQYFDAVYAKFAPLSVQLGEVSVSELSADSAVITGYDQWSLTLDGKAIQTVGRLSIAVAQRNGQWRIVSFHRSAMPN